MTAMHDAIKSLWWLVSKDLARELRTIRVVPGAILLGVILVSLTALQIQLPVQYRGQAISGLLWLAIVFAATLLLEQAFSSEREDGCWQTLLLYPAAPSLLFLAKMAVNLCWLIALELVLIPLFMVMTDVAFLSRPFSILLIAVFTNIGLAAVGTLIGAVTASLKNRTGLVAVLLFPLLMPTVLAATSSTHLMLTGEMGQQWWRWIQLLGVFAALFTIGGALVFEFVIEDS